MRVAVIAPINKSLYSLVLCELLRREPGVELAGILVRRSLSWSRIRQELRRDGLRLLRKVWRKLIVGESHVARSRLRKIANVIDELELTHRTLTSFAREHQVPLQYFHQSTDAAAVKFFQDSRVDLALYAGGGILRRPLLDAAGQGVLNVHLGRLPEYRGVDVIEWPLLIGESPSPFELDLTTHFMDEGIDTGPIVGKRQIRMEAGDTFGTIRDRMEPLKAEMMLDAVRAARDGRLQTQPQQHTDGRQYFMLHPMLKEKAQQRLQVLVAALEEPPSGE